MDDWQLALERPSKGSSTIRLVLRQESTSGQHSLRSPCQDSRSELLSESPTCLPLTQDRKYRRMAFPTGDTSRFRAVFPDHAAATVPLWNAAVSQPVSHKINRLGSICAWVLWIFSNHALANSCGGCALNPLPASGSQ